MKTLSTLLLCLCPAFALANDWDALKEPGAVAIMRHALAPGTSDPAGFVVTECDTQRNLDARGRAQARAIGAALKKRGITFDAVYTSQWCRCRDTAVLLDMGPVTEAPALNSFFQDRATAADQTEAARAIIAAATGPIMMVTHQVNISALTGQFTTSGEILVIREGPSGIDVIGTIQIAP